MIRLTAIILVIAVGATLPQLYQTFLTGNTTDFNTLNLILNGLSNILLGAHGYGTRDTGIFLLGTWFTVYWSLLLGLKLSA
jgi:hypothetical protein